MGYYVSNMIGIRTGGVFGGETDMEDMQRRIVGLVEKIDKAGNTPSPVPKPEDIKICLSRELTAWKGSYVVIAGVFNYWTYKDSSDFARLLSEEFGVEVMHMCWDEQTNEVQCNIWLAGKPMLEINENPIGQIMRRLS